MSNPKISVIIPVYNNTILIKKCLESILTQTLKDIEVICVNDGSTDNTLEILNELAKQDHRIKVIDKENEWQSYARKVGLDNATGEYIMFCDHDDEYSFNTSFEELYNKAQETDVDIVLFDAYVKTPQKKKFWRTRFLNSPKKEIFNYKDIEKIDTINTGLWLCFIKKDLFDRYNDWYFPKKMFYEDTPLHFQLFFRAKTIYYMPQPFYKYILRENSVTYYPKTDKKIRDVYTSTKVTLDILEKENITDENIKNRLLIYFINKLNLRLDNAFLKRNNAEDIMNSIKLFNISTLEIDQLVCNEVSQNLFFIYKAIKHFDVERFRDYINKKEFERRAREIQEQANKIQAQANKIQAQQLTIKQLKHSKSYRIGRLIVAPLSMPIKVYRLIRDYNLLKKSDLFDTEYYLAKNEDVQKSKKNPILHYLRFGWKEGRNPSEQFDSKAYLNQRPDVKVAGICPLVHYIKFGKK